MSRWSGSSEFCWSTMRARFRYGWRQCRRPYYRSPRGKWSTLASQPEHIGVQQACERLSAKFGQLGRAVAEYMSQPAGTRAVDTRALDARGAESLADVMKRIVGGAPVQAGTFPEWCLVGHRSA